MNGTVPAAVLTAFESSTGCNVAVQSQRDAVIARRVRRGGASVPDVVALPSGAASALAQGSFLQPLDRSGLPGLPDLLPPFRSTSWATIGGRPAGVADLWTADVLVYRTDRLQRPPTSMGTIFDTDIVGPVVLPDSITTVADMNLLAGSSSPFSASPETVAAARKLLLGLAASRRTLITGPDELDDALGTGRSSIGIARTNDAATLIRRGRPVEWVVPTEGATAIARTWSIPAGSHRSTCAYRWLEDVLQPDTQAAFSQLTGLAPTAVAACSILAEGWCQATGASVSGLVGSLHVAAAPGASAITGDLDTAWARVATTPRAD